MLKKILTWGIIAFLVFFVAFRSDMAAEVARTLGNTAVAVSEGVGGFFSSLVN